MAGRVLAALEVLRYLPGILKAGLVKIFSFFTSGWYSYFSMFMFVFADHYNTILAGKFGQTVIDLGTKLGAADTVIANNLTYLVSEASGISYITTIMKVLIALFTVLWFLRTIATLIGFIWENLSGFLTYGIAVMLWLVLVLYVEKRLPLATIELFLRLPEVIDLGRIFSVDGILPWIHEGNSTASP